MGILFRSFDFAPHGASLRISAADSRSPAARDRSRLLAPQFFQILRLRAVRRFAPDFGSRLPLSRCAGSLTPASASIFCGIHHTARRCAGAMESAKRIKIAVIIVAGKSRIASAPNELRLERQ